MELMAISITYGVFISREGEKGESPLRRPLAGSKAQTPTIRLGLLGNNLLWLHL
jgi:hypothetical protein